MIFSPGNLLVDLVVAALLGGAVGLQRQAAQKPAGFRTHLLVALASCAFAEVGRLTGDDRITANVLTGIGFLGAGAIFRSGSTAHGLTTAASIWTVAAVGVAVGYGTPLSLLLGIAVTVLALVSLLLSEAAFARLFPHHVYLTVRYGPELSRSACAEVFERSGLRYESTGDASVTVGPDGPVTVVAYRVRLPRAQHIAHVIDELIALPGMHGVQTQAAGADVL